MNSKSKLLVVTDKIFFKIPDGCVYDELCFDRRFFDDYFRIFDDVRVAARVKNIDQAESSWRRADGEGLQFLELAAVQGARWNLAPRPIYCGAIDDAVQWADAVCVRIPAISGWHAFRVAKKLGKPVMFELIGDPLTSNTGSFARRVGGKLQYHQVRKITANADVGSYVSRTHLQTQYPIMPDVPTDSISSIRLSGGMVQPPKKMLAQTGELHLISIGLFIAYKNFVGLLHELRATLDLGQSVSLMLVGDGPQRGEIEETIAQLKMADHVTLTGLITDRAYLDGLLRKADAFVLPSTGGEGLPRVILEAMAAGLPVLASDITAHRDFIPSNQLFDPHVAKDLFRVLAQLNDPSVYKKLAQFSQKTVSEYTQDKLLEKRKQLYSKLQDIAKAGGGKK